MPCNPIINSHGRIVGHYCTVSFYRHLYQGREYMIEVDMYSPWLTNKKTREPFKRMGDKSWEVIQSFMDLPENERVYWEE